jgi:hypothetical protein
MPANSTSKKPTSANFLPACCVSAKTKLIRGLLLRAASDTVGSQTVTTANADGAWIH